ncbi:ABC transporter substrate-binding protein [Roseomonas stagni]|uniref:ABC transporter substrate-binding protein n=1 Tax=Falsiroseomonas algicola TaxID=2716930 RepID=A0A6M1LGL0_9PROT|nr:ABC transporter substrate-binding protein [Falsiroseomonas algicola]NGM19400.1 ABC transporter substrate-binding protein [Falsiroseomonas algicola]
MPRAARLLACLALLAAPTAAQEIRIGVELFPNSLDPHWHNFGGNKGFAAHLYEPLVALDAQQRPAAALATARTATDPTTWRLDLRPGVTFHDGAPLTAADVAHTLTRAANVPGSPSSFAVYLRQITAVETPDAATVILRTAAPFPLMPVYLSQVPIIRATGASTADFDSGRAAIGTGPFRLTGFARGDQVAMARNDAWWGPATPWARATIRNMAQPATRVAALLAGDLDAIDAAPPQDLPRLSADPRLRVSTLVAPAVAGFHLDMTERAPPGIAAADGTPLARNPLLDHRVREALSLAIQRDAIVDRVMGGQARLAGQFMPPGAYGHAPGLAPPPYDPARARALLAEAGYPQGFRLTLHCQNNRFVNDEQICQAVAQMLTRAGLRTTVEAMPHVMHVARSRNREFSLWTGLWNVETGEPTSPLVTLLGTVDEARGRGQFNRGRYSNPAFDSLLDQALAELDDAARERLLVQATEIAFRDVALIPLHHQMHLWAHRAGRRHAPRLDGYTRAMDFVPE